MSLNFETLLLEQSTDALIATTPEGQVLYWNAGAVRIFGYTSAEAVNRLLSDVIAPPDRIEEEQRILRETLTKDLVT